MRKHAKVRARIENRCLECYWCLMDVDCASGKDYYCAKTGESLSRKRLWGRACAAFRPLDDDF